jgi:hypothetical protein
MSSTWQLTLDHRDDDQGLWRRTLTLRDDGSLVLDGHDLGRGVSDVFGEGVDEYEFARTVAVDQVDQLRRALGVCGDDDELRATLEERFARPGGSHAFELFLTDHGIRSEFWNRIGN